jgi:hypothetical protein
MNRSTGSICQITSDVKSIASKKRNASEQVAKYSTCVDVVVKIMCHRLGGKVAHWRLPGPGQGPAFRHSSGLPGVRLTVEHEHHEYIMRK